MTEDIKTEISTDCSYYEDVVKDKENVLKRCKFVTSDGVCKSPINTKQKYCTEIKEEWCYFKQLKRLEQERDELKKTVENQKLEYEELQCDLFAIERVSGCYHSENAELKQENERLYNDGQTEITRLCNKNNKLISALEEIREYINKCRDSHCDSNCEYWDDCSGGSCNYYILAKINEVLDKKQIK